MAKHSFLIVSVIAIASLAMAQKSDVAAKRAAALFMSAYDALMATTPSLSSSDYDAYEAAAKKAGISVERRDLLLNVPRFKPLFNSESKIVPGAVAKFSKRVGQIPTKALDEWKRITDLEPLFAAMSLSAEDSVYPQEKFSEQAFRAIFLKLK